MINVARSTEMRGCLNEFDDLFNSTEGHSSLRWDASGAQSILCASMAAADALSKTSDLSKRREIFTASTASKSS